MDNKKPEPEPETEAEAKSEIDLVSVREKVEHVLRARQSRSHTCHWPGCKKQVPPAMWGCRTHWGRLPPSLRLRVWKAYRSGQEEDMKPSAEYIQIAWEVQKWIAVITAAKK